MIKIGKDIITANGLTLLGSDDKSGSRHHHGCSASVDTKSRIETWRRESVDHDVDEEIGKELQC